MTLVTARVHYRFDAWNRLIAVYADDSQNPGQPGDLVAQYEYDGTNRRVEKQVTQAGGGPRHVHYFYNHDWQLVEERFVDDQGEVVTINQYVWSQWYIDAPIVRLHDGNADGDLTDAEDNVHYYTGDGNYNVTATIDAATGNVLARYVYTAYGTATVYAADWSNPTAPTTSGPLYCGYFFDAETGLYQVRNRYYDPTLALFLSRDPIGNWDTSSLYSYAGCNPTVRIDPHGTSWIDWVPVITTYVRCKTKPEGSWATDYFHCNNWSCPGIAEQMACFACINGKWMEYAAAYGAGNLTWGIGETVGGIGLASLFAKGIVKWVGNAILGGIFTIDGVVYSGCTIYHLVSMYEAAKQAKDLYCKAR